MRGKNTLVTTSGKIIDAHGTESKFLNDVYTYDESFDYAGEDKPLHAYFNAGDKVRNISVTYEPGTNNEVTRKYTIPQRTGILLYKDDDRIDEFYADPEYTELFSGGDGVSDAQLYVK